MHKYKFLKAWGDHKEGDVVEFTDEALVKTLVEGGYIEEVVDADDADSMKVLVSDAMVELKDGVRATLTTAIKEVVGEITGTESNQGKVHIEVGKDRREDDPTGGFKNVNELFRAVKAASVVGNVVDERLKVIAGIDIKAAYGVNEGEGAEGGWAIPPEYSNRMLERASEQLGIVQKCDHIVLKGNSIVVNGMVDDNKNSAAYRYGGLVVYWVGEAGQITRSSLKFRRLTMRLHKMAALAFVTDEELEDSPVNFGKRLTDKAGDAIGDELVEAIMFGNGVGKPQGAFVSDACVSVAKEDDQGADSIKAENVINMMAHLWAKSFGKAEWYHNQELIPQLYTMTLSVGTAGVPVYLPANSLTGAPHQTLFGRPSQVTEHCEALGDTGDIVAADWSQYMLATKGTIKTAMSIHLRFDYDETAFKFTYRVDGRPAWDTTLRPRKGATAFRVAPFVKLADRA